MKSLSVIGPVLMLTGYLSAKYALDSEYVGTDGVLHTSALLPFGVMLAVVGLLLLVAGWIRK